MELKLFPFQSSLVGKAVRKSDDEPLHRKRKALLTNEDIGSAVAFGINLAMPGESGVGYGEEWPLKSFVSSVIGRRISSVFRIRKWPQSKLWANKQSFTEKRKTVCIFVVAFCAMMDLRISNKYFSHRVINL